MEARRNEGVLEALDELPPYAGRVRRVSCARVRLFQSTSKRWERAQRRPVAGQRGKEEARLTPSTAVLSGVS